MNAVPRVATADEEIVRCTGLEKEFDRVRVVGPLDLSLRRGHIVGLVGPNSAGKSTLLRHLMGIYLPTRGSCRVLGVEAADLSDRELGRIGYVHQEGQLLDWLTTGDIIRYVAAHYASWNSELERSLVELFELDVYVRVGRLSPGQRQKLAILLAVGFEPELLLLDEPAAALDPISRRRFLELMLEIIQNQNRTILISSHILSDIEKIIDHVLIMDRGTLLRDCPFDELLEEYLKVEIHALEGNLPDPLPVSGALSIERDARSAVVIGRRGRLDTASLAAQLGGRIEQRPLTLEEIYALVLAQRRRVPASRTDGA